MERRRYHIGRFWWLCLLVTLVTSVAGAAERPRRPAGRVAPVVQWQHDWLDGAVFYEVFVRSFADSDGDGIGDLPGLISRLDYLNDGNPGTSDDLGVTALWLMPIFASPSYHGYDVIDYETVNPDYGDLAELETLVREAEQRGIRIVLDLVVNHTSSQHPWFVASASSRTSPFRDWYVWSRSNPGWAPPWGGNASTWHRNPSDGWYYYGIFWSGMPDLNLTTPAVQDEIIRVACQWIDLGVAGFRLDAARYLIETGPGPGQADTAETHRFWRKLSRRLRQRNPETVLVAESWADPAVIASYYGSTEQVAGGNELPLAFNFPLAAAMIDGVRSADTTPILDALASMAASYPAGVRDAPFLSNHDQRRLASELCCEPGRLRVAASLLLTLPGVPFLYYGEEIGLHNGEGSGDEAKRIPMPWDGTVTGGFTTGNPWYPLAAGDPDGNVAAQTGDASSLLSHYRSLIHLRRSTPALATGALVPESTGARHSGALVFERVAARDRCVVLINLRSTVQVVNALNITGVPEEELYQDGNPSPLSGTSGSWTIALQPHSTAIWRFR